jgi:predicted acetyltransferase
VKLTFEEPHAGLKDSYRDFVREFLEWGEDLVPFPLTFPNDDFDLFLERLSACSRGDGLPEGFVPHTTYWLVRDGVEVVAVSNLRHSLNDRLRHEGGHIGYGVRPSARGSGFATAILRHTLEKAREKGIQDALVTCNRDNVASARTIMRNGGVLVSEGPLENGDILQRYVIGL